MGKFSSVEMSMIIDHCEIKMIEDEETELDSSSMNLYIEELTQLMNSVNDNQADLILTLLRRFATFH